MELEKFSSAGSNLSQENNQYNKQAEKYNSLREGLHQKYVKRPSIERIFDVQDITNNKILDLACGEGENSRFLSRKGARVTGLDLSSKLVEIAKQKNEKYDMNVEYVIGDAFTFANINEQYDFILGVYFLNYAESKEQLKIFFAKAKKHLKPKGRMVFLVPDYDFREYYKKYGIESFRPKNEGDILRFNIYDDDGNCKLKLQCVYWKIETYKQVFQSVGLNYKEHPLVVSKEGIEKFGSEFWDELKENPIFRIFEVYE